MTEQIEMPEESLAPRGAGPQLRLAREKQGLSIADVAARTRISQRHIADLETGNYAAFPSRAYPLGFARTIAKELGLDPEAIAAQVRAEMGVVRAGDAVREGYEPGDPARVPSQPLVWLSIIAAGLLLAGLFVAYRTFFSPAAELPSLVEQQEAEEAAAAAAAREQAAATPAAAASGPVVFTATADEVWVRFYDASGERLLETVMRRGQSFTVPADADGPMINTARPEAFTITIGGRAVPPLATEMMTISDVKVDAASLLARAPAPGATPGATPPAATPSADATPRPRNMAAPIRTTPISEGNARPLTAAERAARDAARRQARPAQPTAAPTESQDAAAANEASAAEAQAETAAPPAPEPPVEAAPAGE